MTGAVLPELPYRIDAQILPHVIPRLKRNALSAEAVHDWRNIRLAVRALHLGNVRGKFLLLGDLRLHLEHTTPWWWPESGQNRCRKRMRS